MCIRIFFFIIIIITSVLKLQSVVLLQNLDFYTIYCMISNKDYLTHFIFYLITIVIKLLLFWSHYLLYVDSISICSHVKQLLSLLLSQLKQRANRNKTVASNVWIFKTNLKYLEICLILNDIEIILRKGYYNYIYCLLFELKYFNLKK